MKELALTLPRYGQINPQGLPTGGANGIFGVLTAFIELLFVFGIIFCLFVLIYAGFQWLISAGDKQKIANQRQRIVYALLGLVVIFLAFFVIKVISFFFHINLLDIPGSV